MIAIFCGLLRSGGRPTVYGDGTQTRDYIYVGDVVAAALAAAASRRRPAPINIGTGIETDVLELVEVLGELGGRERFEPEFAPPRAGEVQRIALDAGRAERELGWRAADGPRGRRLLDSIERRLDGLAMLERTRSAGRRRSLTFVPCPPRPMPARSASASSARGSATSPACGTCSRRPSTSPA